ncbi:Pyruvate kinase barrel domain-containing protein, partial [Phytophthora infestans]
YVNYIAASFARTSQDIDSIHQVLRPFDRAIKVIAKIENEKKFENFGNIFYKTDDIMAARGDLKSTGERFHRGRVTGTRQFHNHLRVNVDSSLFCQTPSGISILTWMAPSVCTKSVDIICTLPSGSHRSQSPSTASLRQYHQARRWRHSYTLHESVGERWPSNQTFV